MAREPNIEEETIFRRNTYLRQSAITPECLLWTLRRGRSHPVVVVVVHELLALFVGQLAQGHQSLEVPLPRRARGEVQQHRRGLAGGVAEAVDAAGGHVHEVTGRARDPLVPVEN